MGAQHEYVGLNQKYVMLRNFIDINNIIKHLHSGVKVFDYKYYKFALLWGEAQSCLPKGNL